MFRLHREMSFSREQQRLLCGQTITREKPGPIVHDFDALLAYVQERPLRVTGMHQLPLSSLAEINDRLSRPLQLGLERPVQKSYPPIHGLYLLLRASGLTYLDETGARPILMLDDELKHRWDALNPTERYCTLLETWLLRARAEIVRERDWMGLRIPDNLEKWFYFYARLPDEGLNPIEQPDDATFAYSPGWHNLGLLTLFGLIGIRSAAPIEGQGWQIEWVRRMPFGEALLALLVTEFFGDWDNIAALAEAEWAPAGTLQGVLQPYFPAWQRTLALPQHEVILAGKYIFKVELWDELWRRLAVAGEADLETLATAILDAFEFRDHLHLHRFSYETRFGTWQHIDHAYMDLEGNPRTAEVQVGSLPLRAGQTMTFLFDFGDHWEFDVTLEKVDDPDPALQRCEVLEGRGEPPEQYPSPENWDW